MLIRAFTTFSSFHRINFTLVTARRMSKTAVNVKFQWGITASDPEENPVTFIGQVSHLNSLPWDEVRVKLEPKVSEETWLRGMVAVAASPGDSVELWPRGVTVASLPVRRSRHAAPSRAHVLAKLVRGAVRTTDEFIVLACRKRDVYACAVAIARSFPLFSARTSITPAPFAATLPAPKTITVTVEIRLVDEDNKDVVDKDDEFSLQSPILKDGQLSLDDLSLIQCAADATRLAARITDTPANIMTVDKFVEEATVVAKELEIGEPTVIRGEELRARGMGGLYGVGAASATPPALVVLSYDARAADTVAWVGKGIVYDTGGLSIKARTSMVGMKGDCGGAAAVLGAFIVAVRAKPKINLHAVLCLAENAVGPNATRPDDIHKLYSGRTVEINNTDAEGRLVLSDGVVYAAKDLNATTIVDIATLTGAQGTATGMYHAAILSNDRRLENACVTAGLISGDLTHPLPFAPELHFTEFTSVVADMKNSVADRNNAQASCAGLFILAHLGFEFPGRWLHVDMASPAHCGERATGYGVALLSVLFGAHTKSSLLNALATLPAR